ncbi:MAG: LysM peptidoglycan-binding domain-containing protein [Anaerolineaceae bacterium]|nr:LysM peptidoglycan-binding domain-containing protein [Anaerolineaceae bacterium]
MKKYNSPQSIIESYKKRQRRVPFVIGLIAALLVLGGIALIVFSLTDVDLGSALSIFATKTLTPTITPTATSLPPTSTFTVTSTITWTPTITITPKISGPFEYIVEVGDNCWDIANKFEVEIAVLQAINNFSSDSCPISPGDTIIIPGPDTELPTVTPIPDDLPSGTEIEYTVVFEDSLSGIADKFNSLVEDIMEINELEDENSIYVGQILTVRVNLPTPTPEP